MFPLFLIFIITFYSFLSGEEIIRSSLGGVYYPQSSSALIELINEFNRLANCVVDESAEIKGIIVPIGSIYSVGGLMAYAYKNISGKNYDLVVILGTSSTDNKEVLLPSASFFSTPLGELPVAKDIGDSLLQYYPRIFSKEDKAFSGEPSIELQLLFIQRILGAQKILPLLLPNGEINLATIVGRAIRQATKRLSTLLVAPLEISGGSRDSAMTEELLEFLENFDLVSIRHNIGTGRYSMRGSTAILAFLSAVKDPSSKMEILRSTTTNQLEFEQGKEKIFISAIVHSKRTEKPKSPVDLCFNVDEDLIIEYANMALRSLFTQESLDEYKDKKSLQAKCGVAVCLYKGDYPRGYAAYIRRDKSLYHLIPEIIKLAAFADVRYSPMKERELDSIRIELSILSSLRNLSSPLDFSLGEEGLYVSFGSKNGIVLPQICRKVHCTKEGFLEQVCKKAGLSLNCYLDKRARFSSFKVRIISK